MGQVFGGGSHHRFTQPFGDAFRNEDGPDVRLAALFHDCGKVVTFSRKERIRFDEHASASAKLAARIGMRHEKQVGAYAVGDGRIENVDIYAMTSDEYFNRPY